jgi:hypothetical protein
LPNSKGGKRQDATMPTLPAAIVKRVKDAAGWRPRLTIGDLWPLLQGTAAATAAWMLARHVVHHHEPFFAPIAALVSLNTSFGERGLNALRLLLGVILGIGVGELTLLGLGGGYGSLALSTFVALAIARSLGGARVMLAQAGIGAILTIAVANGEVGYQRLTDALIGAGVALAFSQLLFSPQPLGLLRGIEGKALSGMATAFDLTAKALDGDQSLADGAIAGQREIRDHLSELARIRRASTRVARHSLVWRAQITPLVQENEDAGHLDLLGGSCLMLTRTCLGAGDEDRPQLAPFIRDLSGTFADLARQPGNRATRQWAVERALGVLHGMRSIDSTPDPELAAALAAARMAITDLLLFVGVEPDEARVATRDTEPERQELDVPAPAKTGKAWVPGRRWWRGLLR